MTTRGVGAPMTRAVRGGEVTSLPRGTPIPRAVQAMNVVVSYVRGLHVYVCYAEACDTVGVVWWTLFHSGGQSVGDCDARSAR